MDEDWDKWGKLFERTGDEWSFAFRAMLKREGSDSRLLVELLRSGKPIPLDVGRTLAELICPGSPDYLGFRLILRSTNSELKEGDAWRDQTVLLKYERMLKEDHTWKGGTTAGEAKERLAEAYGVDSKTIHRWLKDARAVNARTLVDSAMDKNND